MRPGILKTFLLITSLTTQDVSWNLIVCIYNFLSHRSKILWSEWWARELKHSNLWGNRPWQPLWVSASASVGSPPSPQVLPPIVFIISAERAIAESTLSIHMELWQLLAACQRARRRLSCSAPEQLFLPLKKRWGSWPGAGPALRVKVVCSQSLLLLQTDSSFEVPFSCLLPFAECFCWVVCMNNYFGPVVTFFCWSPFGCWF